MQTAFGLALIHISRNWTDVRQFNLMFSTQMGSTAEGANTIYLRPETAQGIFCLLYTSRCV